MALPHVLSIHVTEKSNVDTRPLSTGLPTREFLGKMGRVIRITGWTDSKPDFLTLKGYNDGTMHQLLLPTGDTMRVYVAEVRPSNQVEQYQTYPYEMDVVEEIDS